MIPNQNVPERTNSQIFQSTRESLNYLIEVGLLERKSHCTKCGAVSNLEYDKTYVNGGYYRCSCRTCRSRMLLLENKKINLPKIQLNSKFLAIYEFLANDYEKRVMNDAEISKKSFQILKNNIYEFFNIKAETIKRKTLGGKYSVQVDETVIYKGKLITSPSNLYDNLPGCTWLVGIIEEHSGEMIIEIVPNRKISTLTSLICKHVKLNSLIISDGYPSYPMAVKNSFCFHEVVNHSTGFKNSQGYTTNNIENLWSQIKYQEKKKLGIKRCFINKFLQEFRFRYYHLKQGNYNDIGSVWYEIIEFLIKN